MAWIRRAPGTRPSGRPRRTALVSMLVIAAAVLAGCGIPSNPAVTFYADGVAHTIGPYRYCDARVTHCTQHADNIAHLHLPQGMPVQISVPPQVASAPWTVIIEYRDATGKQQLKRLATFVPGNRYAYTVHAPQPSDTLQTVEVQEAGGAFAFTPQGQLITDSNGDPQLQTRAVWSLRITQ